MPSKLVTVRQAAEILGVSIFTVRRLTASGRLPPVRLTERGNLRFRLEALIERRVTEAIERRLAERDENGRRSPYLTIPEAADVLRCSRQRVDDLLSQRRLARYKDGSRTLVSRIELEAYLINGRARRAW